MSRSCPPASRLSLSSAIFRSTSRSPTSVRRFQQYEQIYRKRDSLSAEYEDYEIDIDKRIVIHDDKEIILTTLEFDLLYMFLKNKGKSYSRDDILNIIWGENYFGSDRVVDDLVRRLRKKMPKLHINTIYGFGYRLT